MGKTALLFTGQGSQVVGMGKDFYEKYSYSKNVFDTFNNNIIGKNISDIAFSGTEDDLKQTINSQPAILATELAILEALKSEISLDIDYVAGHSLGEYGALYCANVISLDTAAKLINARAKAMDKVSSGTMSAIIGLSDEALNEVVIQASQKGYVDIANYNTPQQTVITGEIDALNYANELALLNGAKKAIPLSVSGAFHSRLMKPASEEFSIIAKDSDISNANIPVITNVDAKITTLAEDFRNKMVEQIYSPVHWVQTINKLYEQGVDNYIEIGPSKILTGMLKRTLKDVNISAICTVEDLDKFISEKKIEV